ncbi:MAG: YbaN family protein [Bacteroidota bacterium]
MVRNNILRITLISLGIISLTLGIIGIFVPVLPTTPFLLASVALFAKSSPKLYYKLLNNKYLGEYIKNFRVHKSIPLKTKIFAISVLWISIATSIIFFIKILWVKILVAAIAAIVTFHISKFKTRRD